MKTRELIAELQKVDPSGELDVIAAGDPIYTVYRNPPYYDGPKPFLIQDHSKDPYYNIVGFGWTQTGPDKVILQVIDVETVLVDDPEALVDVTGLHDRNLKERLAFVEALRKEFREFRAERLIK